jgi:AraC-like DNA-binding protein
LDEAFDLYLSDIRAEKPKLSSLSETQMNKVSICKYTLDGITTYYCPIESAVKLLKSAIRSFYQKTLPGHYKTQNDFIDKSLMSALLDIGYLYKNRETQALVNIIFDAIEKEYLANDDISSASLKALTESLVSLIIRNWKSGITREHNTIVEATIKYIQENYMQTIRLAEVAKMLSVSEEHLSRTFKKEITFGFSEYITLIRLQKAEHMLKNEPSRAITEVAYACGFNDSNYFSYKFKKAFGVTPSEVRDNGLLPETPDGPNHIS